MYKYFKYSGLCGTSDVLADPLNECQLEIAIASVLVMASIYTVHVLLVMIL